MYLCSHEGLLGLVPGGEENSWYFPARGVPLYGLYIDPFWNFGRKSRTLFGILCLMEVFKVPFWGLVWEKMASIFQKMFLKLWIFSPNHVKVINQFSLLLVCHLCHQNNWPYLEFLPDIITLSGILWKIVSEFFLDNMTLIRGTHPCTPHMEVLHRGGGGGGAGVF